MNYVSRTKKECLVVSGPGGGVEVQSEDLDSVRADITGRIKALREQVSASKIFDIHVVPPPLPVCKTTEALTKLLAKKDLTPREKQEIDRLLASKTSLISKPITKLEGKVALISLDEALERHHGPDPGAEYTDSFIPPDMDRMKSARFEAMLDAKVSVASTMSNLNSPLTPQHPHIKLI